MDIKELQTTAFMARLTLKEDEVEKLNKAVSEMLDYFSIMKNIDVDELDPTTHALASKNRQRKDEIVEQTETETILGQAPELEDRFIVIPNVL
jgi:aspartyl-tRNA(Asn)/glutamyl-tRNA(Gln) amidotransferase subunit C